jgi:hypothetical protein
MREAGILAEDTPVELIDGLLVYKDRGGALPASPLHTFVTHRMARLAPALEERGCHLRLENPITLPPSHEPEPDGAVVQGHPEDYLERHPGPGAVLCVIEVSDSSLKNDRTIKQSIYAAAGIAQEPGEVGAAEMAGALAGFVGVDGVAKLVQDFFEREGKFADSYGFAGEFDFEIMKHAGGGVPERFGLKQSVGFTDDFDADHVCRAGHAFPVVQFENQAVVMQRNHRAASSFWTSDTKSVAS